MYSFSPILYGIVLFSLSFSVQAQERVLSLPDFTASPGDVIQMNVEIDNADGVIGFRIVIQLPNSSPSYPLEYVGGSSSVNGTIARGWTTAENDVTTLADSSNPYAGLVLISGSGVQELSGSGALLRFRLRVKNNVPNQLVPLHFVATGFTGTRLNDGVIPITVKHGSVLITGSQIPTYTPQLTETPAPPTITPTSTFTPTSTATPTFTPTPTLGSNHVIIVTDDSTTMEDLSNGQDYDVAGDRALAIRANWALAGIDSDTLRDMHVYVLINGAGSYQFLGRTGNGDDSVFEWRKGTQFLMPTFRDGPEFGNHYEFRVYAIKKQGSPHFYGPYDNAGPVEYLLDETQMTPTPTPSGPAVIATDNEESLFDISNGQDHDPANDRKLVIAWDVAKMGIPPNDARDFHVYVQVDQSGDYAYLGRSANWNFQQLVWQAGSSLIAREFRAGPQFWRSYQFKVYVLSNSGNPRFYGPFANAGLVWFLPMITVTDTVSTTTDLSNGQDFDPPNERDLVVRWTFDATDLDSNNIRDHHVYVKVNGRMPYRYLGRTASDSAAYLEWKAGTPNLAGEFRGGPTYGNSYEFKVYPIKQSGAPPFYGPYENAGPVAYQPLVTVTDDISSFEDLSNGQDVDPSGNTDLVIRWSLSGMGFDAADVRSYHIYVFVDNARQPDFFALIPDASADSLEWRAGAPFVVSAFGEGPQIGLSYRFRVYVIAPNGKPYGYYQHSGPVAMAGN